jgi:hypothetical protein
MLQKEWPILVVDDEPDVLAVTRLVLKDVQVDGTPLSTDGDLAVYQDRTALFKSAAGDCLIFRNVSPPSPSLQLLHMSYLKLLAALAKTGATAPQARTAV